MFKQIKNKTLNFFFNYNFNRLNTLKFVNLIKFKHINYKERFFINKFINKFITNIKEFLNNKINITILFKQLTKNINSNILLYIKKQELIFNLLKLRKFCELSSFKFNINIIYNLILLQEKASTILNFLNFKFKNINKIKKLNIYLKFVENALRLFLLKSYSIKGIKIIFKGIYLKSNRTTKIVIQIGNIIDILKINNNLNYNKSICFTIKGTFSIKILIKV